MERKGSNRNKMIFIRGPVKHSVETVSQVATPVASDSEVVTLQTKASMSKDGESDYVKDNALAMSTQQDTIQQLTSEGKTTEPAIHRVLTTHTSTKRPSRVTRDGRGATAKRVKKTVRHNRHSDIFT